MDRADAALRMAEQALSESRGALRAVASLMLDAEGNLLLVAPNGELVTLGNLRGREGAAGINGKDGIDGKPGRDGKDGAPGPEGQPGKDARQGDARGLFDATAEYLKNDVVALNGSGWIAKHDNPGPLPGDGWMQLVRPGKTGERGLRGERGEPGRQGLPGVGVEDVLIDGYDLVVVMSDGRMLKRSILPAFETYHAEVR